MSPEQRASRAVLRLRSAMARAADTGDMQAWLTAATSLQASLERHEPDASGRAELRAACRKPARRWVRDTP